MANQKQSLLLPLLLIGGVAAYALTRKGSAKKKGRVYVAPVQTITQAQYNTRPIKQASVFDHARDLQSAVQNFANVIRPKKVQTIHSQPAAFNPPAAIDPQSGLVPGVGKLPFRKMLMPAPAKILKLWRNKKFTVRRGRVYVQLGKRWRFIPGLLPSMLLPGMIKPL